MIKNILIYIILIFTLSINTFADISNSKDLKIVISEKGVEAAIKQAIVEGLDHKIIAVTVLSEIDINPVDSIALMVSNGILPNTIIESADGLVSPSIIVAGLKNINQNENETLGFSEKETTNPTILNMINGPISGSEIIHSISPSSP